MGLGVVEFWVQGSEFAVRGVDVGAGCRVQGAGCGGQRLRVCGSSLSFRGLGFRV